MNPKSIICPNCNNRVKIGANSHHEDLDNSLICEKCDKPIFPTTEAREAAMTKSIGAKGRNYLTNYD